MITQSVPPGAGKHHVGGTGIDKRIAVDARLPVEEVRYGYVSGDFPHNDFVFCVAHTGWMAF
uniref:Uncharacterized protein n=1 Tax=Candidatus Kentrum sp. LFY TaxID=2126342 RepID=A0A450UYR3_9GAMM|nr:MAG: hypothetical protein BECKLFY1418B_GA0070995_11064 [Candidatus Kentron sp. LFY]